MPEYTANSVGELLKLVESFPHMMWIFRGQADADWPLLSKAGRPEYFIPNSADEDDEWVMVFKGAARFAFKSGCCDSGRSQKIDDWMDNRGPPWVDGTSLMGDKSSTPAEKGVREQ